MSSEFRHVRVPPAPQQAIAPGTPCKQWPSITETVFAICCVLVDGCEQRLFPLAWTNEKKQFKAQRDQLCTPTYVSKVLSSARESSSWHTFRVWGLPGTN